MMHSILHKYDYDRSNISCREFLSILHRSLLNKLLTNVTYFNIAQLLVLQ